MKLFGNSHHPGHDGLHRPEGSDGAYTPETDPFDEVPPMPETGLSQDTVTFVPEQMKSDSAKKAAPDSPAPESEQPSASIPLPFAGTDAEAGEEPFPEAEQFPAPQGDAATAEAARKKKTVRRIITVAAAAVLTVLAVVVAYAIWERPPEIPKTTSQPVVTLPPVTSTPAPAATATAGPTDTPKPIRETEPPEETEPPDDGEDTGEAPAVVLSSDRKEGVYTVLLVGVDKVSNSTDTIMVVSFDTKNHTISGTSIPRDTLINIGWFTTPKKINAVYPGFLNNGQSGIEGLKLHVKSLLGFEVDNYVVVYLQAVEDAIDAIGGVEFDVPIDMYYNDPLQDLYIAIPAGRQILDGHNALNLCRFRSGYPGGDLQRIETQHAFLTAVMKQMIAKGIPNLPDLVDVLMKDVETDLEAANIAWFLRQFLRCAEEDVVFQTAPNYGSGINGISFVGLDVTAWLDMVNSSINPYVDDVTIGNVNILTFDGGGGVYSTTGAIAGGYDSFYCLSCTIENGGVGIYHAPGMHLTFAPADAGGGGAGEGGEAVAAGGDTGEGRLG